MSKAENGEVGTSSLFEEHHYFLQLRELLAKEPATSVWKGVMGLFAHWPVGGSREVALAYADAHLDGWESSLRRTNSIKTDHPAWPLVRHVDMYRPSVEILQSLSQSLHIEHLTLSHFPLLSHPNILSMFPHIRTMTLKHCFPRPRLTGFESLILIELLRADSSLKTEGLYHLSHYGALELSGFQSLVSLSILGAEYLEIIVGLDALHQLQNIVLQHCEELRYIDITQPKPQVHSFTLENCYAFEGFAVFEWMPQLVELRLSDCTKLQNLSKIRSLPHLQTFVCSHCEALVDESL